MDDATPNAHTFVTRARAAFELTKPGITTYVMVTAGVSGYVASRGHLALGTAFHAILGTALSTAGALALNQYAERRTDALMIRTRHRPLPSGRLEPLQALTVGVLLLLSGLGHLVYRSGLLPAMIAALSAGMYLALYTPLKRRSSLATLVGGVPGALPTLIGWSAAVGSLDSGALALFAIAYFWQLPHVLGLAWMLREDYARVGFKLIPEGGSEVVARHMVSSASLLVPISVAPTLLGCTGLWYLVGALVVSTYFARVAFVTAREMTDLAARRLFLSSLLYHPLLLGLMLLDTVRV